MGSYMGHTYDEHGPDIPAQSRFQVGDRVRVVRTGNGGSEHGADIGYCDTIIRVVDLGEVEGRDWFYHPSEIQHIFKPGDHVRVVRDFYGYRAGNTGAVTVADNDNVGVRMDIGRYASFPHDALEPVRGAQEQPCIVAAVEDGRPTPSRRPMVHDTAASATAEAERLARNSPGQQYDVYQRVGGRVAEVSYEMKEVA